MTSRPAGKYGMKASEAGTGLLYILPSFVLLLIFHVIPIAMTLFYSFTKYNAVQSASFIGLANYRRLFSDSNVATSFFNTILYTVITVPLQTMLALLFAELLAKKSRNRWGGIVRSSLFIPVICSMVMVGIIWRILLATDGGFVNTVLGVFGISQVNWLGGRWSSLMAVCMIGVWKNVGYFLVIFYAGVMDIPSSLYEAAKVDGASGTQQFFKITLPMLRPITYLAVTLGTIWSFQVFDLVYTMTGGGPGRSTITLVYTIYTSAFKEYNMGYSSAVSILMLVIILLVSAVQKALLRDKG